MRFSALCILMLTLIVCGCQTPRTSYADGFVLWLSSSAVGIGYGRYVEVPAGGSFSFSVTNSADRIFKNGKSHTVNRVDIDNKNVEVKK